jgi:hypothetical protein
VRFAAITFCVASQRVFIVDVVVFVVAAAAYFVIDSVRKSLDTPSYKIIFRKMALILIAE